MKTARVILSTIAFLTAIVGVFATQFNSNSLVTYYGSDSSLSVTCTAGTLISACGNGTTANCIVRINTGLSAPNPTTVDVDAFPTDTDSGIPCAGNVFKRLAP